LLVCTVYFRLRASTIAMPITIIATIMAIAAYVTYVAVLSGCVVVVVGVVCGGADAVKCASAHEP
jgi:hypothetical protein